MTDYHPPEHPELDYYDDMDGVPCPRCQGFGVVECYCCGDFCCCDNGGDEPCGSCDGEGYISEESYQRFLKNQREMIDVLEAAQREAEKGQIHD